MGEGHLVADIHKFVVDVVNLVWLDIDRDDFTLTTRGRDHDLAQQQAVQAFFFQYLKRIEKWISNMKQGKKKNNLH